MRTYGYMTDILDRMDDEDREKAENLIKKYRTMYFEEGWEISAPLTASEKYCIYHKCGYNTLWQKTDVYDFLVGGVEKVTKQFYCTKCDKDPPEHVLTMFKLMDL